MRNINIFLNICVLLFFCANAFGEPAELSIGQEGDWDFFESNFFIVYYRPDADLEQVKRKLETRILYFDQTARYGETSVQEEIGYRLDKLFNQVREILDMYPRIPKIKIKIFQDRTELNEEHLNIFGEMKEYSSFYVNGYHTIYTSEDDISDSVMAHEMAHVVIDHYFSIIPPKKMAEVLASYVDVHLDSSTTSDTEPETD